MGQDPAADVTAALRASIANLGAARPDLGTLLEQTMAAMRHVLKVTGAGLMMFDDQQDLRYIGASDEGGARWRRRSSGAVADRASTRSPACGR
jgi:hypothetical protein